MLGLGLSVTQLAVRGLRLTDLAAAIRSLFAAGEQGVWYDPSDLTTLYQDAAGTTPVTAVEQPVGRILDKSGRGNHATQTTSTSRPVLSARVNLLTKTEQFDNAVWTKTGVTVIANSTTAPDGTTTADTITENTAASFHAAQTVTTPFALTAGTRYTITGRVKNVSGTRVFQIYPAFAAGGSSGGKFNLQTGVATAVAGTGSGTASMQALADGWYECTFSFTAQSSVAIDVYFGLAQSVSDGLSVSYTGDGSSAMYFWGADFRASNDGVGLPAYQRVNTAIDYDTAGFPHYLRFDGVDDFLVTNSIGFTAIDKMTVFAGVRKLSDAAGFGIISEFGDRSVPKLGSFAVCAPQNNGTATYYFASYGSTLSEVTGVGFSSPITNILTGIGDISGDRATLRINGTQVAQSTADQGAGNYGNYPLYIGRRGGTTLPFNGHLYSLIVRGAQSTEQQIIDAERYVNDKTRAYA